MSTITKLPNELVCRIERADLSAMIEQVPDYFLGKDLEFRFVLANEAVARISGIVWYYFSRPVPCEEIESLLKARQPKKYDLIEDSK